MSAGHARRAVAARRAFACGVWAVAAVLAGCAGDAQVTVNDSTTITKGRELLDLQRALQEGALKPDEYERLRQVLLRRRH